MGPLDTILIGVPIGAYAGFCLAALLILRRLPRRAQLVRPSDNFIVGEVVIDEAWRRRLLIYAWVGLGLLMAWMAWLAWEIVATIL